MELTRLAKTDQTALELLRQLKSATTEEDKEKAKQYGKEYIQKAQAEEQPANPEPTETTPEPVETPTEEVAQESVDVVESDNTIVNPEPVPTIQKKEVEAKEFIVTSNGGAITIAIMGNKKVNNIEIDADLLDDKDMLQDLLTVAVNEAIKKVDDEMNKVMNEATGGMRMPGMF